MSCMQIEKYCFCRDNLITPTIEVDSPRRWSLFHSCFDDRWSRMLAVLIILFYILGWMCFISICVKQKELKSDGRMPGSFQGLNSTGSPKKVSEPVSPAMIASAQLTDIPAEKSTEKASDQKGDKPTRKKSGLRERKRKFSKDDDKKTGSSEKKSDEKAEQKSDEKKEEKEQKREEKKEENEQKICEKKEEKNEEKKEESKEKKDQDIKKNDDKDKNIVDKTDRTQNEKTDAATSESKAANSKRSKPAEQEAVTQMIDVQSSSKPFSARDSSARGGVPCETLALLAAAEQMALDKGDYDNFGPPGVQKTKKDEDSIEKI